MDHRPPRPDQPYAWDDERLSAYLDGELSAPEQAQLEARLVVDPELRQLVDELRAVRQQLEILPEYRLQATFAEQVLRRAEQEMLLSPLGREKADSPLNEVTATVAANAAAAVIQPAISPLPNRPAARRWQRGVIWTAVAAAAVLLLIVTNQPRGPEQDQLARHDLPSNVAVETGGVKSGAGMTPSPVSKSPEAVLAKMPRDTDAKAQGFDAMHAGNEIPQNDRNGMPKKRIDDAFGRPEQQSEAQKVIESAGNTSPAAPPILTGPINTAPKQADAAATNPSQNQIVRAAADKKQDSNQQPDGRSHSELTNDDLTKGKNATASGKMLLKSQAAAQPLELQQKQFSQRPEQLPTELAALLTSDEFSQLATPRDEKNNNEPAEEQVLVVYLTPRGESLSNRSFESLLTSNSIELAEKSFSQQVQGNRQRKLAATTPKLDDPTAEPLAKASSDMKQNARATDHKPADLRETGNPDSAGNGPAMIKEKGHALASESPVKHHKMTEGNELYYLEAEADQVEELLRQLRAAPDRFLSLSITGSELPQPTNHANLRDEKSPTFKPSPSIAKAESNSADSKLGADITLAGSKERPLEQRQFTPGDIPAPPYGAQAAGASAPPATPAAEPAAMPFASPAAPPSTSKAALPRKPLPAAAAPAASPMTSDAPATIAGTASPKPGLPKADQAIEGHMKEGQEKEGLGTDARGSRRAGKLDKSLQQAVDGRIIAYRLRVVESLMPVKNANAIGQSHGAGGGFGGGEAEAGKAEFGNTKASEAEKSANDRQGTAVNPSSAAGDQKAGGQAASSAEDALRLTPKVEPIVVAPQELAAPEIGLPEKRPEEKPGQQPMPKNAAALDPDHMPVPNEAAQRLLPRNKETVTGEEKGAAESAKKSAPPASKRVRVLFVIEHESTKE